jgi:protein-export membrane protein SecD
MLQVSFFSRIVVVLVVLAGILVALPNAFPQKVRDRLPHWLPRDAVTLGLDLQGGSYLLMQADLDSVQKDKAESLLADLRTSLRKAHIGYTDIAAKGDTVSVKITDAGRYDDAKKLMTDLNPTVGGSVLGPGTREYDLTELGGGGIALHMTDAYKAQTKEEILEQSVEVVRKRIDEMGTREPTIIRQGDDRILIQVPGLSDPANLIKILNTTAKMSFQLVDESADPGQAARGIVPIGDELLPQTSDQKNVPAGPSLVVQKRVMVTGDRLTDARAGFDPQNGEPVVNFRFDTRGAKEFGDVTKENVNHRFAIVLDKKIISAPNIREPILGGSGQISGSFTTASANDLSILLRAGALPAPLKIVEQRTVGAELGADSIKAGRYSAIAGLILVVLFMIARYGLFGVFADIALTLNVVLLLAALTLFGATLTLPGIAGIVLTMGMAVDANVLVYERIREEQRNGRGMLAAIDTGFRRAMATIIDANMTHLIAALILFELGSGPVRGFAVTLGVGIITSFFTAVMVTRLIVVGWLHVARPRKLVL